jgi:hypothetical protein
VARKWTARKTNHIFGVCKSNIHRALGEKRRDGGSMTKWSCPAAPASDLF